MFPGRNLNREAPTLFRIIKKWFLLCAELYSRSSLVYPVLLVTLLDFPWLVSIVRGHQTRSKSMVGLTIKFLSATLLVSDVFKLLNQKQEIFCTVEIIFIRESVKITLKLILNYIILLWLFTKHLMPHAKCHLLQVEAFVTRFSLTNTSFFFHLLHKSENPLFFGRNKLHGVPIVFFLALQVWFHSGKCRRTSIMSLLFYVDFFTTWTTLLFMIEYFTEFFKSLILDFNQIKLLLAVLRNLFRRFFNYGLFRQSFFNVFVNWPFPLLNQFDWRMLALCKWLSNFLLMVMLFMLDVNFTSSYFLKLIWFCLCSHCHKWCFSLHFSLNIKIHCL